MRSKAFMKTYWREHKRICENKKKPSTTHELADELPSSPRTQALLAEIKETEQQLMAEYMGVHRLCTDSAITMDNRQFYTW